MNSLDNKLELIQKIERAFFNGHSTGSTGRAFEILVSYVVALEERIEQLEHSNNPEESK
jgi:hypothetical protein